MNTEISLQKEVGRHQGTDRPGVRQVPEGSGEQRKMRKLVVKSSVVLQRLRSKGVGDDEEDPGLRVVGLVFIT